MDRFQVFLLVVLSTFVAAFLYTLKPYQDNTNNVTSQETNTYLEVFNKKTEIVLTGDIMLGRSVNIESLDKQNDPRYPFLKVADVLQSADLVFGNLETPIIDNCPRIEHGFTFCADPRMIEGLTYAGVDIVSLANNHTTNFGSDGLAQTKNLLSQNGLNYVGTGDLVIKEIKGVKYGFLGFDFTVNTPIQKNWDLVSNSNPLVDILIVGVHWGEEYKDTANANQQVWAKNLVDLGADVVVGHHPHWVQNSEEIEGKPVYYSLGNFVFDQMWSEETKKGLLVKLTFENGELIKEELLPTYIKEWGQPEFVTVIQ
jgi:poly-gamma-glutamate synthesis protein (capsule biosynthesis protein)